MALTGDAAYLAPFQNAVIAPCREVVRTLLVHVVYCLLPPPCWPGDGHRLSWADAPGVTAWWSLPSYWTLFLRTL
ncbi:hypothetical protein RRG08_035816 [Elysia crispata]|uniref:Uncharacterized protein n=1 Tax=Elysia crispata TaxID=231223 RepID=A0AAE1AL28_9GAST|nr:hypothetical protein RRG08_035816 [Elysia crispata]